MNNLIDYQNITIDTLRNFYINISTNSVILKKQKIEFDIVYERFIFDKNIYQLDMQNQLDMFPILCIMYICEKSNVQQGATMFWMTMVLLKQQIIAFKKDIRINNFQSSDILSDIEKRVVHFNTNRPYKRKIALMEFDFIKKFSSKFSKIPLDCFLIDNINNVKINNNEETSFFVQDFKKLYSIIQK